MTFQTLSLVVLCSLVCFLFIPGKSETKYSVTVNGDALFIEDASLEQTYKIEVLGWHPETSYFIVVSCPSTFPIHFTITPDEKSKSGNPDDISYYTGSTRRLLDTTTHSFKTKKGNYRPGGKHLFLLITAHKKNHGTMESPPIKFAVEIETFFLGVIPHHQLPIIAVLLIMLFILSVWLAPLVFREKLKTS